MQLTYRRIKMKALFRKPQPSTEQFLLKNYIQDTLGITDQKIVKAMIAGTIAFNAEAVKVPIKNNFGSLHFNTTIKKAKSSYTGQNVETLSYNPAIIVTEYDKSGKFVETKLCTAPMIFEEPEAYDDQCYWLLMQNLSKDKWNNTEKRLDFIEDSVKELQKRDKERKKKAKEYADMKLNDSPKAESFDQREKFFWGAKSFYGVPFIPAE